MSLLSLSGNRWLFLLLLLLLPYVVLAEEKNGLLNLQLENDLLNRGSDGHYTHGTRIAYLSAEKMPRWLEKSSKYLPFFRQLGSTRTSYALGQSIFTPKDISRSDLIVDDRPYAGWLYFAVGLLSDSREREGPFSNRLDSLELNLGVVGPASLAEQVQKAIHKLTESPPPQGWHHQLENEPGIMLIYDRQWQGELNLELNGLKLDLTPHVGGALGNVLTYAAAGVTLRFGRNLHRDYGAPLIRPSSPGSGFFKAGPGFGWYLFAGIEGRAILQNIFLDGNTFKQSHSVDKEPLVADFQAGFALTWRRYRFSFTNIYRTQEFETQQENTQFGSLSLTVQL